MATAFFEIEAGSASQFVDAGRRYVRFQVRFQAADGTRPDGGAFHTCDIQVGLSDDAATVRAEVRRVLEEQVRVYDRQVRAVFPALPAIPTAPVSVTVPDSY